MSHVIHGFRRHPERTGFTLVELLVVLVIIGVLAAITLSVSAGVRGRAASDRARAELAVLTVGLEEYRRVLGAYPQGRDGGVLLAALAGRIRPGGEPLNHRPFVSLTGLTLRYDDADQAGNLLLDPWGRPYAYRSFTHASRSGYRLYSIGPDGLDAPPTADGEVDETAAANLDNRYAHH